MTDDLLDRLASYHPTTESVDAEWSPPERARVLDDIRTGAAHAPARLRFTPRRWAVAAGVAAGAAAAAIVAGTVLPAGSPGGPGGAGAAALERLATTAAHGPALRPDQFSYIERKAMQHGDQPEVNGRWTDQFWAAPSGTRWYVTDRTIAGKRMACVTIPPGPLIVYSAPTPRFLASLPRDPDRLRDYLRHHVEGSSSNDEAVFSAVSDMLGTDLPSPQLRAVLFRVLTGTGHIRVTPDAHDSRGRTAVKVSFVDQHRRPGEIQSLYFDPKTSQVIESSDVMNGHVAYRETTVRARFVDSVPAGVRACPVES